MAIDYVEIRDENTTLLGIVDTAKSIIWRSVFFGVGDFEIYVQASPEIVALLQVGNLVTRPNDNDVAIVESIKISDDSRDGCMITATGRMAKCILERRLVYNLSGSVNTPTILQGNVENAARQLVEENAIDCKFDSRRNIPQLILGDLWNDWHEIVDENGLPAQKQVSCENLLTCTDALLQEYGLGAKVILDADAGKLCYVVYSGIDRSWSNAEGNDPVVFSKEYDNLTSSDYEYDTTKEKNVALIGGAGDDVDRFFSIIAGWQEGLHRREMWIDAKSMNRKYKDADNVEHTYPASEYRAMLNAVGNQKLIASPAKETFDGTIDIQNSRWQYNVDFALGDVVTMQNDDIGKYINVRMLEVLEVQDENGYSIEANNQA